MKRTLRYAIGAPALLGLLALGGLASAQAPGQFRFDRLNREYREIAPEIQPIVDGPVTVRLSSPRSNLILRNHLLRLEPGVGGSHSADLRVELEGSGWLVADVSIGGLATRLQDQVTVPAQAISLQGQVRLRRSPEGYLITPEQLPKQVAIKIQSAVGQQIVELCDGVAALPLTALDCPSLRQTLSRAVVPLPAAGESYLLENADLTPQERQRLDDYLRSAGR